MSKFIWVDPKEIDNQGLRVAAVNTETYMIEHIFDNVICAAKALKGWNIAVHANKISKALNNYHMKYLGYYWKRVV